MAGSGIRPVIVTCAVTGSVHVPSQSPYLPLTPEQIAQSAIDAGSAGAAILHLHARIPETGRPTPDPDVFMRFLPEIKERSESVINITTGGGQGMTLEQRLSAALRPGRCDERRKGARRSYRALCSSTSGSSFASQSRSSVLSTLP